MELQLAVIESPTKQCSRCRNVLELGAFGVNRTAKDGLQSYCRACTRDYHRRRKRSESIKERKRLQAKASKYGISVGLVKSLLHVPCCQACGASLSEPGAERIDHCHQRDHVRGVLCHKCNLACAGPQLECIARLRGCVSYLERDLERLSPETSCRSPENSESNCRTGLHYIATALSAGGRSPTTAGHSKFTTSSKDVIGTRPITRNAISVCAIVAMTFSMTVALLAIFRT